MIEGNSNSVLATMVAACLLGLSAGCQGLRQRVNDTGRAMLGGVQATEPNGVDEEGPGDESKSSVWNASRLPSWITGSTTQDKAQAQQHYKEADELFREAREELLKKPRTLTPQIQAKFARAAKLFEKAGKTYKDSALEQDALYMMGESLVFSDQLDRAVKVFSKFQKDHQRNRHSDRVAARLFEISQYWIDSDKAKLTSRLPFNFSDPKFPRYDPDGNAIRVLDNIRFNDPTSALADDATLAAGVEYMANEKYEQADEFFTDLRTSFPNSEHQFNAHILGLRTKLLVYAGPEYGGMVLDEAEELVAQTKRRFAKRLEDSEFAEEIDKIDKEIRFKQAERLITRAQYREKRSEYSGAQNYYQMALDRYPNTPFSDLARDRLEKIADYPASPQKRLAWLANAFSDPQRSKPLRRNGGSSPTLLR